MSEPEDVILDAAHFVTARTRALWASGHPPRVRASLDDVRRRLELFVAAVFPSAPSIGTAEPPAPLSLLARLAGRSDRAQPRVALSCTDGERVRLPASVHIGPGEQSASFYRLLAVEQGARAERGTPALAPGNDRLVRDLFALAEAAAVDAWLATQLPNLRPEIAAARRSARLERPASRMTARERAVEQLLLSLLDADPLEPPAVFPRRSGAAQSLAWARSTAAHLCRLPGRYRGVAPVSLWGTISPPHDAASASHGAGDGAPRQHSARTQAMRRRPRVRTAAESEDDETTGTFIVRADDPQESVEDPMGLQRPVDQEQSPDAAELGDALSDLPEARLVRTPDAPREILASDEPLPRAPLERIAGVPQRFAIAYPEWDYRVARYAPNGALVHEVPNAATNRTWAEHVLAERAVLVRRVRRDFERLRPRREFLYRQLDGSDVDVDAWVASAADAAAATCPDERLYRADRRARRDTAIFLLVDASASTDSWVGGLRRVIDVEREALLVVSEALAALGDRHAIHAFRGEGSRRVELIPLKRFAEPAGTPVRARIAGLEPDGYTRVGAAVRHATMLLLRERARQRLLLLLSDGRPNDVDVYEGRYGLEDTRRAFAEARAQDVNPFCVTVDREAPAYASHVFGHGAHAMLRDPERLPQVLLEVLHRLLRR